MAPRLHNVVFVSRAILVAWFLVSSPLGWSAPVGDGDIDYEHPAADDHGDVPADLPPLDTPHSRSPVTQSVGLPFVTPSKSASNEDVEHEHDHGDVPPDLPPLDTPQIHPSTDNHHGDVPADLPPLDIPPSPAPAANRIGTPSAKLSRSVRDKYSDDQHTTDDHGDVPADLPPLDVPPNDAPAAQSVDTPVVTKSGSTYTWTCKYFNGKNLGPLNVYYDTWGGYSPNMNREYVPDPKNPSQLVFKVTYAKGTTTPSSKYNPPGVRGGTGFNAQPIPPEVIHAAKVWTLEYSVYFPPEFQWVRGGKLPGLFGAVPGVRSCSGGSTAEDCFSARYMWRKGGAGEAYVYVPVSASQDPGFCYIPPVTVCDPGYGNSIARGAIQFTLGAWTRIKMTIMLNTVGQRNGVLKLALNGVEVLNYNKIVWRVRPDVVPQGIMFQTFFGGSTADYATPIDTYTLYKDFVMTATV